MKIARNNDAYGVRYRTQAIGSVELFYREAGDPVNPTILLLHGFPSSSHMFRNLIEQLSDEYHLVAPDYPGFGYSDCPDPSVFDYTFDHLAEIMEQFIDALKLQHMSFYMQDYGGPVGFRIIKKRPELVRNLIIQNATIFLEGLGPDVLKIGKMTDAQDFAGLDAAIEFMMSLEGIKSQLFPAPYIRNASILIAIIWIIIFSDSQVKRPFKRFFLTTIAAISPDIRNGRHISGSNSRLC